MPAGDVSVKVDFGEQAEGNVNRWSKIACSSYLFDCPCPTAD